MHGELFHSPYILLPATGSRMHGEYSQNSNSVRPGRVDGLDMCFFRLYNDINLVEAIDYRGFKDLNRSLLVRLRYRFCYDGIFLPDIFASECRVTSLPIPVRYLLIVLNLEASFLSTSAHSKQNGTLECSDRSLLALGRTSYRLRI